MEEVFRIATIWIALAVLDGVALSTTSMAVFFAALPNIFFNKAEFGKGYTLFQ